MVTQFVESESIKAVADAIRTKGGTTAPLAFPDGMVQAINDIQAGGGGGDTTAEDALITGTITDYSNDRVTGINTSAFFFTPIESVSLPNVTHMGQGPFQDCSKLKSVYMPKVTELLRNTFRNCRSLVDVSLPSVKTIRKGCVWSGAHQKFAFKSLTLIEGSSFARCYKLDKFIIGTDTVAVATGNSFEFCNLIQIYVPDNLVDQYKVATNWTQYADRIHPMSELPPEERI